MIKGRGIEISEDIQLSTAGKPYKHNLKQTLDVLLTITHNQRRFSLTCLFLFT